MEIFEEMVREDTEKGLIPFWLNTTHGTTSTCSHDDTEGFNKVCQKYKIWHNLDAAYQGVAWVIPYERDKVNLENIDSILINGAKFFMVGNTGSLIYVRNKAKYQESFMVGGHIEVYKNRFSG